MVKPGYKQTEVGMIPEPWKVSSLAAAFQRLEAGVSVNSDDSLSSEYHILKTSAVHDGVVDTAEIKPVIFRDYPRLKCPLVKGSIIISRMNTPALVGECGFAKDAKAGTYLPDRLWQIQNLNKSSFDFVWLNYLLNTKQYRDAIRATATGTSNSMKNISKERLLDIKIPHPPISEQENIAAVLSEMDELINLVEKQINKKKAIKQGAMQELLTGKRRLPGFSGEWETRTLHEMSNEMVDGPFGSNLKTEHYTTERQVRIIQLSNIGEAGWNNANVKYTTFSHAAELQRCIVQPGSILIAKMMPAGRAIICPDNEKSYILGSDVVKIVPNSSVDRRYLVYATKSRFYLDQIADDTQGSTRARTSVSKLRKTAILFPEKDEQIAIADILSEMDMEIAALEGKLAKYRQVKQGMMQQLLTGKIRLKNDVVDSVHTEQKASAKKTPVRSAHNHQFDDAVAIAAIVDAFYSDKYPLGRVKVQKLLYLLHRHQGICVSDFKKKTAGPYADTVRYKGGEPIARKNKYIVSESGKQGTRYFRGENMAQALDYVERWGMQANLQWLKENFLHTSRNDLELFATVDMAMCDLDEVGISVSVESIKNLIASNKEWKAKLSKTYFSDWDIARAIKKCTELFN